MRVLLVKMSSLGDVVHALVPITDAALAIPGIEFDWVIEEAYQAIPGWHPAVRRIIPVALRRWRRSPWAMIRDNEWFRFRADLRKEEYDLVLDAQGLMKSGWIGTQARGPLAGRSRASAREPLASAFYSRRFEIDLTLTEVEQLRQLFALALGYAQPRRAADFGVDLSRVPAESNLFPTAVLVHGAAWPNKLWPFSEWCALAQSLCARGFKIRLPWGSDEEKRRAEQIAVTCNGEVLPKLDISGLAEVLHAAAVVVGLDTGLTHIAIALRRPTVTLYGPSVPVYNEVAGGKVIHLSSSKSRAVETSRKNTVPLAEVIAAVEKINELKSPA
jgi:heptosyltransferase-1